MDKVQWTTEIIFPAAPVLGNSYVLNELIGGGERQVQVVALGEEWRWSESARSMVAQPVATLIDGEGNRETVPYQTKGNNDE